MFIMHDDHPVPRRAVGAEQSDRQKYESFLQLAKTDRIYAEFKSVDDLKAKAIQSLIKLREVLDKRAQPGLSTSRDAADPAHGADDKRYHQHLISIGKLTISVALALSAVVGVLYELVGPLWPTQPVFSPGHPSFGTPFDIPFKVENKSGLFAICNIKITCHLIYARSSESHDTAINTVIFLNSKDNVCIGVQGDNKTYTCPYSNIFGDSDSRFEEARLEFISEYDSPWPLGGRTQSFSSVFTLDANTNPPQWVQGVPLR
jgi:hypothetical protein